VSAQVRALAVVLVVAAATWGEGGASASSLLVTHLALAAAFAVFILAAPRGACAPSTWPSAAWLLFVLLAGASAMVAPYAYAAWLVMIEIVAFGALVWLASGDPPALVRALTPALALLGAAHGTVALAQRLAGNKRPASSFLNPNHLAAWLAAIALFLASGLFNRGVSERARVLYGLAAGVALAGIFVTGSRGAMLGLAAGAAALVVMTFGRLAAPARRGLLATVAVLLVAAGAGVAVRFRHDDDPYRFHRTRIWAASMRAAAHAPWLGVGPGQFAAAAPNMNFPLPDAPLNYERAFTTPHSDVLRAVCEFGFPAALAAFAAAGFAAWELFRRRNELSDLDRAAVAALAAVFAQALVDDLTTRPAITMLIAALSGAIVARRRQGSAPRARWVHRAALALLFVCALGFGELAGFASWNAVSVLPRGRLDASQLARLHRSIFWNPMQPAGWQRLAEHFAGDSRSWRVEDYAAAREAAEHARRLQPADAFYARAAARIEAAACLTIFPFQSTRERAARLYGEAEQLARTDATIPLEAARFLLQAGDAEGARRAAEHARDIEPRAAAPRLVLAQAVLRADGPQGAAKARQLLDEALASGLKTGEAPTSSYDASLRGIDPVAVEAIRRALETKAAP
jgi:O-antigen ligase